MNIRDETTLNAINKLRKEYPYVCSLLIYTFIEQELKFFVIRKRSSYKKSEIRDTVRLNRNPNSPNFLKYARANWSVLYKKWLKKCTLGTLERLLWIKSKGISNRRNQLIHQNEYISFRYRHDYKKRQQFNYKRLGIAIQDLLFCSKKFFEHPIIDKKGILKFDT